MNCINFASNEELLGSDECPRRKHKKKKNKKKRIGKPKNASRLYFLSQDGPSIFALKLS
jgi:hypothetical protein